MDRFSFRVTEENRRRLEILKAFAVLGGKDPTYRDIVNEASRGSSWKHTTSTANRCPNLII